MRVSYVSCICNSLRIHKTFNCLYGKNQRCSRSGFRFIKKNHFTESIIRKFGTEFEREENIGENQNGDCSVFAYAFVDRSNQFQAEAFSQLHVYDQQTRPVLLYQTVAIWQRTQKYKKQQHTFWNHF